MSTTYLTVLQKDERLATIITEQLPPLSLSSNIILKLMGSIMSQQLSTKVAAIIYQRFLALFPDETITTAQVIDIPDATLRGIGLSNAKVLYVKNVARFCEDNNINHERLMSMDNQSIIDLLTQIKGVGQWTVEMLLMFGLGRENVFAVDDLGIQQAMTRLYALDSSNKKALKANMQAIAAHWQPYQTYACLYLWRWKDVKPAL